ncbi:MAG: LamG domain-containing protein [Bacteroidota bacterium]|jgi:hypothetical protein
MNLKNIIFSLFTLTGLSWVHFGYSQDIPYYVPTNGLLAWIPLEGTTLDKSGNGNDALGTNLIQAEDRFNRKNKAVFLDGINSYIKLEINNPELMLNNNFTISIWIKPNFATKNEYIFSKGDKMTNEYALLIGSNNTICFEKNTLNKFSCIPLIKNQWSNVTLVISNNTSKIYINGKLANVQPLESPILSSPLPLTFGAIFQVGESTPVQNSRFNGIMDDISIWSRVLSDDEILLFFKGNND